MTPFTITQYSKDALVLLVKLVKSARTAHSPCTARIAFTAPTAH